jgi:hypothetical protein
MLRDVIRIRVVVGIPGLCVMRRMVFTKNSVKSLVLPENSDILRVETVTTRRETMWTQSVPYSMFESLTSNEIKRQEPIFEFIQGEFNYVQDLEALYEFIVGPLASGGSLHGFPGSHILFFVFIRIGFHTDTDTDTDENMR